MLDNSTLGFSFNLKECVKDLGNSNLITYMWPDKISFFYWF